VVEEFFDYHLDVPYNNNVPDVQHTVALLDHLDRIDYYHPEWLCFHDRGARVRLGWKAIKNVLLWLVKRKHVLFYLF
jgi:hypothetical protein